MARNILGDCVDNLDRAKDAISERLTEIGSFAEQIRLITEDEVESANIEDFNGLLYDINKLAESMGEEINSLKGEL